MLGWRPVTYYTEHRKRILGYVEQGKRENLKLSLDRTKETVNGYSEGHWVGPAVFEHVDPRSTIGHTEILGPVAALSQVQNLDEAITMIGRSAYGKRDIAIHHERKGRAGVPIPGRHQHDRNQHRCCGADGLLSVRRIQNVLLRRSSRSRFGRDSVLHGPPCGRVQVVDRKQSTSR